MKFEFVSMILIFTVLNNNIHGALGLGLFGNVVPSKEASCHDMSLEEAKLMPGYHSDYLSL